MMAGDGPSAIGKCASLTFWQDTHLKSYFGTTFPRSGCCYYLREVSGLEPLDSPEPANLPLLLTLER